MQKIKFMAVLLMISTFALFAQEPQRPFGLTLDHGYTQTRVMPTDRTQTQMNQDVVDQFNRILRRFIVDPTTSAASNKENFLMVLNHDGGTNADADGVAVCESHGFGMVMLAYMAGAEDMMVPSNPNNLSSTRVPLRQRLWENLPEGLRSAFDPDEVTIKHYFDAAFRTMKQFSATNGAVSHGRYLMAWQIVGRTGPWRRSGSVSTATDGALDMTYALLLADRQWGGPAHGKTNTNGGNAEPSDSEYLYHSKGAMRQLLLSSINTFLPTTATATHTMTVGNWVSGNNRRITRPSDFMITHWKSFNEVGNAVVGSGATDWQRVIDGTYTAINQGANATTGLLPDFLWYGTNNQWRPLGPSPSDGLSHWNENATNDQRYNWNACRVPWRIGLDILHTGISSPIDEVVSKMNSSMNTRAGGNFTGIRGGQLNGTFNNNGGSGFAAPYLVTAAAYGPENWMTNGWAWARGRNSNPDVYGDYIHVLSMIAASGNWWSPVTPTTPPTHLIRAQPSFLEFGFLEEGYEQPEEQTVTITNIGTDEVTLDELPTVENYTLNPDEDWTTAMAQGETRTFTIRPNEGLEFGTYNPTITITGSDGTKTMVIANFKVAQKGFRNVATGFIYMFTNPTTNWAFGYNNNDEGNSIEFDVTKDGDHTLTLTWQSGAGHLGTLHSSHRDIYVAQPTADSNPDRLPVTIHSVKVNGAEVVGAMTTHAAAPNRWLVDGTIGTINPVTISGANANAHNGTFAEAGLELRTFYIASANAFTIPSGATLEITYRVGTGTVKEAVTISGVTEEDGTYNGDPHTGFTGTPVINDGEIDDVTLDIYYRSIGNNSYNSATAPTNAGNYKVTFVIPASNPNYTGEAHLEFTIAKAGVTISGGVTAQDGTYNGAPHTGYTGTPIVNDGDITGVTFSINYTGIDGTSYNSTTAPTNAGNYRVTFVIAASNVNYVGDNELQIDFTIEKATNAGAVTMSDWTFGDPAKEPQISGHDDSNPLIEYSLKDADEWTTEKPQEVGEYTVRVTLAETENCEANIVYANFEIKQRTGISEVSAQAGITLSPTLTRNMLTVKGENLNAGELIKVYGISGALVATYSITGKTTTINVSQLPDGMYLLKTGGYTGQFVKQ